MTRRRIFATMLALAMLFCALPVSVMADDTEAVATDDIVNETGEFNLTGETACGLDVAFEEPPVEESPEGETTAEPEGEAPAFDRSVALAGATVRVSAAAGVFPAGAALEVSMLPMTGEIEAAVAAARGPEFHPAERYAFNVGVVEGDAANGLEIQGVSKEKTSGADEAVKPPKGQGVTVAFTLDAIAEGADARAYRVEGGAALMLDGLVEDGTLAARSDGLGVFVVEVGGDSAAKGARNAATIHVTSAADLPIFDDFSTDEGEYDLILDNDITLSGIWTLPIGTMTLNLNGHSISNSNGRISLYYPNTTLNLYGEGEIKHCRVDIVGKNRTFNMYGGTITGNEGHGVYLLGGTVNMYGGAITGNVAEMGGGVIMQGGSFNMYDGSITDNKAESDGLHGDAGSGGGVYMNGGTFIMKGGSITGNSASNDKRHNSYGGGVFVGEGGEFTMSGGSITGNRAVYDGDDGEGCGFGGGVCVTGDGRFTMKKGKIGGDSGDGNEAQVGGGVFMDGGAFTMPGGSVTGNLANLTGGGICASGGALTLFSKPVVRSNRAGQVEQNVALAATDFGAIPFGARDDFPRITIDGAFTSDAYIGVSLLCDDSKIDPSRHPFTVECDVFDIDDPWNYFHSDDPDYAVGLVGGEAVLHKHTQLWFYTVDGDTLALKAHGGEQAGITCELDEDDVTMKIVPPKDAVYDGNAHPATLVNADALAKRPGVTVSAIHYRGRNQTAYDSDDAPVNAGEYTASVTVTADGEDYVPEADFTVAKAKVTVVADTRTKYEGDDDPELTYAEPVGLVGGDRLSGALAREPGEEPGEYAITIGTLTAGDNYEIEFVGAKLTILSLQSPEPIMEATPEPTHPAIGTTPEPTATPEPTPYVGTPLLVKAKVNKKDDARLDLAWTKVDIDGVEGYDVFMGECNGQVMENALERAVTVTGERAHTTKQLKKGVCYKFRVKAFMTMNGEKLYVAASPYIHVIAGGSAGKYGNVTKVSVKSGKIEVSAGGKGARIRPSATIYGGKKKTLGHCKPYRYKSSDPAVATVSDRGVVKGVGAGTCKVYVFAPSGVWTSVRVKVE